MRSNALYTDLSHYYDLMCADIDYQAQSHTVLRLNQMFGNGGRAHVDLACGTGPHLEHFIRQGFTSHGLDINQPMLDLAAKRCPQARFSQGDMCAFTLTEPVDLITCFLYSVHYSATLERLAKCFEHSFNALNPGGVLCFNAVDKNHINNASFTQHSIAHAGSTLTFRSGWQYAGVGDAQTLRLSVEKQSEELLERWEDEHPMVAVGFAMLQKSLEKHFAVHVFSHDYDKLEQWDGQAGNAIFVCVKH